MDRMNGMMWMKVTQYIYVFLIVVIPVIPICAMGRMNGMMWMKCVSAATVGHSRGTENIVYCHKKNL